VSGYSGTPLAQKLGLKAGSQLYVMAAPADYLKLLAPVPDGMRMVRRIGATTDVIHLFATERAVLERALAAAHKAMRPDAAIWVSWPKKASGTPTDINENVVRELALPGGLVDVKVCAVDDTWSGLKLMVRRSARPGAARRGR
jgi:hypothetical protein